MPQFKLIEIIGVLLALVALIGAAVGAYKFIDSRGYARGEAEERALWQARESEELATANAEILRLTDLHTKLERELNTRMTQDNNTRRKADEDEDKKRSDTVNAIRAGLAERLCVATASQDPVGGAAGAVAGTTGGVDGPGGTGLLTEAAEFLSSEAARADRVVRLLGQAQSLLRAYRDTCNSE